MTKKDFIEKLVNTDLITPTEAAATAEGVNDYESFCLAMYYAAEDLTAFNALITDKIGRDFTAAQLARLDEAMCEEW